jgi:hemerythrin-like metal-binding protein
MADGARREPTPFDDQHQLQGALIDAYEAALLDGTDRRLAAETLARLVEFTAVHFADEEALMAARGYPELEAHHLAHQRAMEQVLDLERGASVATREASLASIHRLRRWLLDHVNGPDRAFAGWLASRPAPPA